GREVRSLLHFAFVLDPFYDEAEMHDIDVRGTRNALEAALVAGIPHVVATSSTTAYGALADNPVPLTESSPPRARPGFSYAHDKRVMDEMLGEFARAHPEIALCTIRPCIVLGPTVANYIATTMLRQPVVSLLDGADPPFQFIHEDDLARLVALCLERKVAGVFNAVGTGTAPARSGRASSPRGRASARCACRSSSPTGSPGASTARGSCRSRCRPASSISFASRGSRPATRRRASSVSSPSIRAASASRSSCR